MKHQCGSSRIHWHTHPPLWGTRAAGGFASAGEKDAAQLLDDKSTWCRMSTLSHSLCKLLCSNDDESFHGFCPCRPCLSWSFPSPAVLRLVTGPPQLAYKSSSRRTRRCSQTLQLTMAWMSLFLCKVFPLADFYTSPLFESRTVVWAIHGPFGAMESCEGEVVLQPRIVAKWSDREI